MFSSCNFENNCIYSPCNIDEKFCVIDYSIDNLKMIFNSCSIATVEIVESKLQSEYFETYFNKINAKTLVIESNYMDNHFLDDYSEYYVKCFNNYQKTCNRIHFFSHKFDKNYLLKVLEGNEDYNKLTESYLGFMVVKKLPQSIIGTTCLATYSLDDERVFPATRIYHTHLYGIPLQIKSLAYQEQDRVVAACATSSLWTIFQSTGKLFQHQIPSPVKITKAAISTAYVDTRSFPNHSLTLEMIASAIRSVGLEPYKVKAENDFILKATVYAYLKAKIPSLMAVSLKNIEKNQTLGMGHAVAITGFKMKKTNKLSQAYGLSLKSSNITKFYVHDDQVGPFARMDFNKEGRLTTSWGRKDGKDNFTAIPFALTIPLYDKIRIPFNFILSQVSEFDQSLKLYSNIIGNNLLQKLEWDIYLIKSNELKEKILNEKERIYNRKEILLKAFPEYLWYTEISLNNEKLVSILFDSTDIEQNINIIDCIKYDVNFFDFLVNVSYSLYSKESTVSSNYFISWLSAMHFKKTKTCFLTT